VILDNYCIQNIGTKKSSSKLTRINFFMDVETYLVVQHSFLQSSAQAVFSSPAQQGLAQSAAHPFAEVESFLAAQAVLHSAL